VGTRWPCWETAILYFRGMANSFKVLLLCIVETSAKVHAVDPAAATPKSVWDHSASLPWCNEMNC